MTTTVSTEPVQADYTKSNIFTAAGNYVINDPLNVHADETKFNGTIVYHTTPASVGRCIEANKADYVLVTDAITLTYTND